MTHRLPIAVLSVILAWASAGYGGIYRWTDADGRVRFGDRPPAEVAADAQELSERYASRVPFSFRILPMGYVMRPDTRVKVEIAVTKIHEILGERLGLSFQTNPSFDIRIFKDRRSYASYGDGPPLGGLASGYYSPGRNEAVTWRQNRFELMLEVITHEANHALMRHHFGDVPPWLNEGLSEYFERMEVFGQAVVIHPNDRWDRTVRERISTGTITPLKDYLALSHVNWQLHNVAGNRSYAQAWSLVYFLMSSPKETRLLAQLLRTLERVGAERFSGAEVIEATFDGGMDAFEVRWRAWALGPKHAHHY